MRIFKRWRLVRKMRKVQGRPGVPFTRGDTLVTVTLTPQVAREAHDRAMQHGFTDLAAKVEPFIPSGGKAVVTNADRAMIRRLMRDAAVV